MVDIANLQIKVDSSSVKKADSDLKSLSKTTGSTENAVKGMGKSARRVNSDFGVLQKSIFTVKNLIGTVLIGSVINFADEMSNLSARIGNSTRSLEEYGVAWAGLNKIVSETGGSLSSAVEIFQRLSFSRDEIKASVEEMLQFTETVQKLGVVSGASTTALNAGLLQLGQALSSDVTRAEEFNSIMENIPSVGTAIAEEFGVTTGELRRLVLEGKVLSEDVFAAILNQSEKANQQFENMPLTIGRATAQLVNQFKSLVNGVNQSIGATDKFAALIQKLTEAVKALEFSLIFTIKLVDSLITAAVAGIINLTNKAIAGLNKLPKVNIGLIGGDSAEFIGEAADQNLIQNAQDTIDTLNRLFGEQTAGSQTTRTLTQDYKELAESLKDTDDSAEKAAKKIKDVIDGLKFNIDQLGRTNLEQEVYNNLRQAGTTLDTEAGQQIQNLTEQFRTMEDAIKAQTDLAKDLQGAFEGAFESAIFGAESFSDVLKSLANDIQRILFKQALSGLGQEGFFGALAGSIRGGFGLPVADIPGFATGGSFMVGGKGGIDNNLLSLNGQPVARVSQGETVNVTPSGGSNSPSIMISMNIQTPDADSFRRSQGQILSEAQLAASRAAKRYR